MGKVNQPGISPLAEMVITPGGPRLKSNVHLIESGYHVQTIKGTLHKVHTATGQSIQLLGKMNLRTNLLFPNGPRKSIKTTEHKSLWRSAHDSRLLSGLDRALYKVRERQLIMKLISSDEWIIEEKNDLIAMLNAAGPF